MDVYNTNTLKRNPGAFDKIIKISNDITTVTEDVTVIFPSRYINRDLATIESTVNLINIYAIVDTRGNYTVISAPIKAMFAPNNVREVSIDDTMYIELSFNAGDVLILNNNLLRSETVLYDIFDEFFIKGNVPWFMGYEDLINIFDESKKYTGNNIGKNPITYEILASISARIPSDKKIQFRQVVTNENKFKFKPTYVGLNNVYYSFDNTGAKIIGSYFGYGMTAALVEDETRTSTVTDILRS